MRDMTKEEKIKAVEKKIKNCRRCELWKTRNNPVVGECSLDSKIMFIGEAPGYNEDLNGKPFVGRAGLVFDELLESAGLQRKEIYITNIIKCRPPDNRNPSTTEIKACTDYLNRQISIIQPDIIVTLGNFALSYVFERFGLKQEKIGKIHGKVFKVNTIVGSQRIIPLYHPATATYDPGMKSILIEDFKSISKVYKNL